MSRDGRRKRPTKSEFDEVIEHVIGGVRVVDRRWRRKRVATKRRRGDLATSKTPRPPKRTG